MKIENMIDKFLRIKGNLINIKFLEDDKIFQCLVPDDQLLSAIKGILILEEYEKLDNFKLINFRKKTIVDAGCHVGLFSMKASVYAKRVICIEPHPVNYRLFEINLLKNRDYVENIVPINAALWYKNESVYLSNEEHTDAHSIIKNRDQDKNKEIKVNTLILSDIIRNYGEIDLLKLDIEGAEFDVILNMSDEHISKLNNIVGEVHMDKSEDKFDNVIKKLKDNGFSIVLYNPPIYCHTYSLNRILTNWKKIEGLSTLKIFLIIIGTIYSVACRFKIPSWIDRSRNTKILYAYRKL